MGKFFFQCFQLFDDDFCHCRAASKDFLIQCNVFQCLLMFCHQGFDLQSDQLVQTHFQNGSRLTLGKMKHGSCLFGKFRFEFDSFRLSGDQAFFRLFDIFASAQDFDDQINDITGLDQTFLNLTLVLFFFQQCCILAGCKLILKLYVVTDHGHQSHGLRFAICYGQHVYAKSIFQSCLLI